MAHLSDILAELVEWLNSPECGPKEGEDWAEKVRLYLPDFTKAEAAEDAAYARGYAAGGRVAFQRIDNLIKAELQSLKTTQDADRKPADWLTKLT